MPLQTDSLDAWLIYLQQLDPNHIELGLTRVQRVLADLVPGFGRGIRSVLVAGTNGKGSTATLIDALVRASGRRSALYTSPHFQRFTERLRIDGQEVAETQLVDALARVEKARGSTGLTYFEFTTLAAFWLIAQAQPDVMVLEIGLGGRLDAVNAAPADCSVVTTIGLDHTAWLGDSLAAIAREKAGIARPGKPLVVGADVCAHVFQTQAGRLGAELVMSPPPAPGTGLRYQGQALPEPVLPTASANLALTVIRQLGITPELEQVREVLVSTRMPGRLQELVHAGRNWVLDIGHNPQAAAYLARELYARGPWSIVLAQVQDKDVGGVVQSLAPLTAGADAAWYLAGLDPAVGGLSAQELQRRGGAPVAGARTFTHVPSALRAAAQDKRPILVCGSFHTVTEALTVLGDAVA